LSFRTGKSFLQAGKQNGCRCVAVSFCSNIWTGWAMYILRSIVARYVILLLLLLSSSSLLFNSSWVDTRWQ
jgi:hypothetical protein